MGFVMDSINLVHEGILTNLNLGCNDIYLSELLYNAIDTKEWKASTGVNFY